MKQVPWNEFENQESRISKLRKIVNRRNMWMIQRCQHFGLALKTGNAAGIATRLLGQYLMATSRFSLESRARCRARAWGHYHLRESRPLPFQFSKTVSGGEGLSTSLAMRNF